MSKFYIHTDDGDAAYQDSQPFEYVELLDARRAALRALPDMVFDMLPDGDRRTFTVTIEDEQGLVAYSATLDLVGKWHVDPTSPS